MGGPCAGTCQVGRTRDGTEFVARPAGHGRPPVDPGTGKRPPAGSYGPYCRCRTCGVYIIWDGLRCPCCARTLSRRPRPTCVRGRQRAAAKRKAEIGGAAGGP